MKTIDMKRKAGCTTLKEMSSNEVGVRRKETGKSIMIHPKYQQLFKRRVEQSFKITQKKKVLLKLL